MESQHAEDRDTVTCPACHGRWHVPSRYGARRRPAGGPASQSPAPKDQDGMMMGGDTQGMMKMMGQMTKMMEKCDQMMQTRIDDQKEKTGSPKKDRRG